MIIAAALCPAPPLLMREVTGTAPVVEDLWSSAVDAAAGLAAARPDLVAVVGVAEETGRWDAGAPVDPGAYAPALRPDGAPGPAAPLPLPLGLGGRLLDAAGYPGPRILQAVGADEPAARCAELGAGLAGAAARVALLVMADGSARRGLKAPGYLDERSAAFDAGVQDAVRDGDVGALLAVDADLARELMATGRAAWQVLAGAMDGLRPAATIRYRDDPFGVAYLVASLEV